MTRLLVTSFAALALFPTPVAAQDITRGAGGTISVRATDVPLERLLQALGEISPFEKIVVKDGVGARLVSVTLENVPVIRAIVQALDIAGVDYVLGGGRLVVGDSSFGGLESPAPAPPVGAIRNNDADDRARKRAEADAAEARATEDGLAAADAARDAADAQIRSAELERVLSAPALPIPVGAPVDLPFPGPDGWTPISVIKPAAGPVRALPFPASTGTTPPATTVPPTDPRVQQLIDALTPKRPPGK